MNLTIRSVVKQDNPLLASMIRAVFEEHNAPRQGTVYSDPTTDHLYELFQHPGSVLWIAEIDHQVMGCCGVYPTRGLPDKCAELVKFYLAADARGKGIGKALMQRSIDTASDLGYTRLYIESLPEFFRAVSMYEKQGFERLSEPLGSSDHPSCDIWMLKKLDVPVR